MLVALMMVLQASVGPSPDGVAACDSNGVEIVVCGRAQDPDRYRLPPAVRKEGASAPPRAEWGLGGGVRAGVGVSQKALPQGAVSNRVMATIKLPF